MTTERFDGYRIVVASFVIQGVVKVGTGVGQLLVPAIAAALIAAFGWRNAAFIIGTASALILVVVAQQMRRDPRSIGQHPGGVAIETARAPMGARETGMSVAEAAGTRQFWILCAAQLTIFFCLLTVMIHIVPHATDLGIAPAVAATILSTIGAAGPLLAGTLFDTTGNYEMVFLIAAGFCLLGLLLAAALGPMKARATVPARQSTR